MCSSYDVFFILLSDGVSRPPAAFRRMSAASVFFARGGGCGCTGCCARLILRWTVVEARAACCGGFDLVSLLQSVCRLTPANSAVYMDFHRHVLSRSDHGDLHSLLSWLIYRSVFRDRKVVSSSPVGFYMGGKAVCCLNLPGRAFFFY